MPQTKLDEGLSPVTSFALFLLVCLEVLRIHVFGQDLPYAPYHSKSMCNKTLQGACQPAPGESV